MNELGQKQPEKFTDQEAAWPSWSWRFRNYLAAANPATRLAMTYAEPAGAKEIEPEAVAARGWTVFSDQRYSSLVGFTAGESESILKNTKEGNGLEAWRRLELRWHSTQLGSRVTDKLQLQALSAVKDDALGKAIQDWEVQRTEYMHQLYMHQFRTGDTR